MKSSYLDGDEKLLLEFRMNDEVFLGEVFEEIKDLEESNGIWRALQHGRRDIQVRLEICYVVDGQYVENKVCDNVSMIGSEVSSDEEDEMFFEEKEQARKEIEQLLASQGLANINIVRDQVSNQITSILSNHYTL